MKLGRSILFSCAGVLAMGAAAEQASDRYCAAVHTAASGTLHRRVFGQGTTEPVDGTARVRSLVDGQVVSVSVREGDVVRAGTVLAELRALELSAEVQRLEAEKRGQQAMLRLLREGADRNERAGLRAEIAALRAEYDLAAQQSRSDEQLALTSAITTDQLARARAAAAVSASRVAAAQAKLDVATSGGKPSQRVAAKARIAAADAALTAARQRASLTRLVAPMDGVVLRRNVDPGDTISMMTAADGPALFEIADVTQRQLRIEVEEIDAADLAPGLPVLVQATEGEQRVLGRGLVTRVSPRLGTRMIGAHDARQRADSAVRTAWAEVEWNEAGSNLPIAARVSVRLELPPQPADVVVPRSSVKVAAGRSFVEVPTFLGWRDIDVVLGDDDDHFVSVPELPPGTPVRVFDAAGCLDDEPAREIVSDVRD